MNSIENFFEHGVHEKASDIYIVENKPISFKIKGKIIPFSDEILTKTKIKQFINDMYILANRDFSNFKKGDDDFVVQLTLGRFRVNTYLQQGNFSSVVRIVPLHIPDYHDLKIPQTIMDLSNKKRGLILFTGTAGSGKSTSMACVIDKINQDRTNHIITIEEPIEYIHSHKKSIISQREIGTDTENYSSALRAAMRQAPDVILVGEMRDQETISSTVTAGETGHLVFSTLHTIGASATIDRIIDSFPASQQNQIMSQLAATLQAVVSQQLIPTLDGSLHPVYEIMIVNNPIRNLIREGKTFQIDNIIQTSSKLGMQTMDSSILNLLKKGIISKEEAFNHAVNQNLIGIGNVAKPHEV